MWSRAHSFRHEMPLSAVLSISKTLKFQSFMARSQANKMICDTTRARAPAQQRGKLRTII